MHQRGRGAVVPEALEHAAGRDGRGQRHGAAGQGLGQGDDIRHHPRSLAGEEAAGAPEADENLIEDEQGADPVGGGAQPAQHGGIMHLHPASTLHQGFDQDGRDLAALAVEEGVESLGRGLIGRQSDDMMLGQQAGEEGMHTLVRIADRHGADGVAVIAVAEGQEAVPPLLPPVQEELDRHFHGDLDPRPSRSREKNTRSRSPGSRAARRRARVRAGSCTSPPNMTWGRRANWAVAAARI